MQSDVLGTPASYGRERPALSTRHRRGRLGLDKLCLASGLREEQTLAAVWFYAGVLGDGSLCSDQGFLNRNELRSCRNLIGQLRFKPTLSWPAHKAQGWRIANSQFCVVGAAGTRSSDRPQHGNDGPNGSCPGGGSIHTTVTCFSRPCCDTNSIDHQPHCFELRTTRR